MLAEDLIYLTNPTMQLHHVRNSICRIYINNVRTASGTMIWLSQYLWYKPKRYGWKWLVPNPNKVDYEHHSLNVLWSVCSKRPNEVYTELTDNRWSGYGFRKSTGYQKVGHVNTTMWISTITHEIGQLIGVEMGKQEWPNLYPHCHQKSESKFG